MAPSRASRGGETPPRGEAPSRAAEAPPRLTVALVRSFRGLRGQVRVELLTDRPEVRFAVGALLHPEGTSERLTVADALPVADGPGWWLRFREIGDRNTAEDRLRGRYLEIDDPREPREAGRWFWHELEGLAVSTTDGQPLGEVVEVYRAGGAEVFVVRGPRGELDVPGVRGIVTELAPDRGVMVVDLDRLALDARPVDDADYVRPRDRRPQKQRKGRPGTASARGSTPKEGTEPGTEPGTQPGTEPAPPSPPAPDPDA